MRSDLIVMTFEGNEMAETVYRSLLATRSSQVLGLADCAVINRDGSGILQLLPSSHARTGMGSLIAHQILDSLGSATPENAGVQVDDLFMRTVVSALRSGGSALLFYVDEDGISDTRALLDVLALFRGKIHQTTLCTESVAPL